MSMGLDFSGTWRVTKLYPYKGRIALYDFQRQIVTFCCLIYDNHRQLRVPVTTYNRYLHRVTCDSIPGVRKNKASNT